MVLESLGAVFGNVWQVLTDFIILVLIIIYMALFFIVQYFLIKGYIWLITNIYKILIKFNIIKEINFKEKWKELKN